MGSNNVFHFKPSKRALLFIIGTYYKKDGLLELFRKWHIILDIPKRQIVTRRRNWHFINFDEETYAFKSLRNVK